MERETPCTTGLQKKIVIITVITERACESISQPHTRFSLVVMGMGNDPWPGMIPIDIQ